MHYNQDLGTSFGRMSDAYEVARKSKSEKDVTLLEESATNFRAVVGRTVVAPLMKAIDRHPEMQSVGEPIPDMDNMEIAGGSKNPTITVTIKVLHTFSKKPDLMKALDQADNDFNESPYQITDVKAGNKHKADEESEDLELEGDGPWYASEVTFTIVRDTYIKKEEKAAKKSDAEGEDEDEQFQSGYGISEFATEEEALAYTQKTDRPSSVSSSSSASASQKGPSDTDGPSSDKTDKEKPARK